MKNHIEIGSIYREHGLKGLCKVYIYSQSDENLAVGQEYLLQAEDGQILKTKIQAISYLQKFFLIDFDCFTGGDQVVKWRKAKIWLPENALQQDEGEMYEYEWQGVSVLNPQKQKLGVIVAIEHNPLPQFVVECQGHSVLIPWVEAWILDLDEKQKTVVMDLPEGLFDLEATEPETQKEKV